MSDGPSDEYPEGRPDDADDSGDDHDPPPYDDGYPPGEFDPRSQGDESALQGRFQVSHHTARMPESVGSGVFANALMVLAGPMEVILDFVQRLSEPNRVVARVVLPPVVAGQFVATLRQNIERFEEVFGELPQLPKPLPKEPEPEPEPYPEPVASGDIPGGSAPGSSGGIAGAGVAPTVRGHGRQEPGRPVDTPGIDDIYRDLRLEEDMASGRYANAVIVRHTPAEFAFDFVTRFVPHSSVSARVIVAAPNVASMLASLEQSVRGKYDF